jgi:hypothetical protein
MRERIHEKGALHIRAAMDRDGVAHPVGAPVAVPPRRDHAACFPVQNMFRVPLRLLRDGQAEVRSALPLEVKR